MRILTALVLLGLTPGAACADSLFTQQASQEGTLIGDRNIRYEVGEIITVLVREEIQAETESDTDTRKEADVESEANKDDNTLVTSEDGFDLMHPDKLPNWNVETENQHRTTGQTARDTLLETTVTCVVTQVFSNGNILIEGERLVAVNREDSTLVVRGVARSKDISPGNTIRSSQLANAEITLRGRGPLWNNQRRGLITKFLDWVSPF